jgi:hypothetical protein
MKNYIVTSYIPNTHIDAKFVETLNSFCNHNNAELQILQCKENYRSDSEQPLEQAIRDEFGESIRLKSYNLNKHLHVSDFQTSINTIDPLTGMESMAAKHGCLILPFPRHRFKTVPRMLKESGTPRAIWCSGTISEPDSYKNNKSGRRMKDFHVKGALFVQVEDDKIFHIRQITFDGKGFYDLNTYYEGNKFVEKIRPEAIVLGDDHAPFQKEEAMKSTIEMIKSLDIRKIVRQDTLDCCSISHHVEGKKLTRALINLTLEQELKLTSDSFQKFEDLFPKAVQYSVMGNHPEHLGRYIDEGRYRDDYPNHIIALELALAMAKGSDVYEYSMKKYNKLKNVKFLQRKDSVKLQGIEIADHGDEGANGSRGTPREKGITYSGKVVTGHSHSPEIGVFNNYVTGTLTHLSLSYTKDSGSSGWLNTNVLIYPNGTMTHIHII